MARQGAVPPSADMGASLKNKHTKPMNPIGVAWYRPEQWALLREVSVDREKISETWSDWEATASQRLAELRPRGLDVQKVDVDVRELLTWCERRQRPVDGAARSEFVAEQMRLRAQAG